MKIARQRFIAHPPRTIWRAISPVGSVPSWLPGAESAKHVSGPRAGKGRRQLVRRTLYRRVIDLEQEVMEWRPERVLSLRHMRETEDGRDMAALQDFHTTLSIEPAEGGSCVTVEYSWEVGSLVSWLLSVVFAGRTMGRDLRDILAKVEKLVGSQGNPLPPTPRSPR